MHVFALDGFDISPYLEWYKRHAVNCIKWYFKLFLSHEGQLIDQARAVFNLVKNLNFNIVQKTFFLYYNKLLAASYKSDKLSLEVKRFIRSQSQLWKDLDFLITRRKSVLSKLNDQRLKVKMERDSKYHFWLSIGRIWSNFRSFWSPPISNICAGEGNNIWFTFGARYHIRNFSHLLITLLSSCSIYLHQSLDLCKRISVRAYIECCDTLPWNPSPNWPVFKTHKQCLTKENDKNKQNSIFRTRPSWRTRTRRSSWNWVPCRVRVSAALDP